MRDAKGIVDFSLWVERGAELVLGPEYAHRGTTYVEGVKGERYVLRARNLTDARIEVIPTVDGLDVQSGEDASFSRRGLVLAARQSFDFAGFRLSQAEVATFRFGGVEASYASQIGKPRNVGVIGVAVFEELAPPPVPRMAAPPGGFGAPPPFGPPPPPMGGGAPPGGFGAPGGCFGPPPAPGSLGAESPAPALSGGPSPAPSGLGTTFGERRESKVSSTQFTRASSSPVAVLSMRYEDRAGLRALGIDVDGLAQRETANPFPGEPGPFAKPPPGWRG